MSNYSETSELFSIANGLTRGYGAIILFASFLFSVLYRDQENLIFTLLLMVSDELNHWLKIYVAKPIMKNSKWTILGWGKRPNPKAISCMFPPDTPSKSYGMPSGHSQFAWVFSTYWIWKIWEDKERTDIEKWISMIVMVWLASMVGYSRVKWMKCHTVQQVVVGGMIGILVGTGIYNLLKLFRKDTRVEDKNDGEYPIL